MDSFTNGIYCLMWLCAKVRNCSAQAVEADLAYDGSEITLAKKCPAVIQML